MRKPAFRRFHSLDFGRDAVMGKNSLHAVMHKAVLRYAALLFVSLTALAPSPPEPAVTPKIMPLDQVKAGMKGVAYTVFEGVKPEPMEVEILGILRNSNGQIGRAHV